MLQIIKQKLHSAFNYISEKASFKGFLRVILGIVGLGGFGILVHEELSASPFGKNKNGDNGFHQAVKKGQLWKLILWHYLYADKAETKDAFYQGINKKNADYLTPIEIAARKADFATLKTLLQFQDESPNKNNENKRLFDHLCFNVLTNTQEMSVEIFKSLKEIYLWAEKRSINDADKQAELKFNLLKLIIHSNHQELINQLWKLASIGVDINQLSADEKLMLFTEALFNNNPLMINEFLSIKNLNITKNFKGDINSLYEKIKKKNPQILEKLKIDSAETLIEKIFLTAAEKQDTDFKGILSVVSIFSAQISKEIMNKFVIKVFENDDINKLLVKEKNFIKEDFAKQGEEFKAELTAAALRSGNIALVNDLNTKFGIKNFTDVADKNAALDFFVSALKSNNIEMIKFVDEHLQQKGFDLKTDFDDIAFNKILNHAALSYNLTAIKFLANHGITIKSIYTDQEDLNAALSASLINATLNGNGVFIRHFKDGIQAMDTGCKVDMLIAAIEKCNLNMLAFLKQENICSIESLPIKDQVIILNELLEQSMVKSQSNDFVDQYLSHHTLAPMIDEITAQINDDPDRDNILKAVEEKYSEFSSLEW